MSLYNLLFGKNAQASLLLAVIGMKEHDVPRFRDVFSEDDGATIAVHTRMGGGNRGHWDSYDGDGGEQCDCPGCRATWALGRHPLYLRDEDDDFDSTYATYYFRTPEGFAQDVANLADPLTHGLRPEFGALVTATLRREPTDADREQSAHDREAAELARTQHVKANGHTFVPYSDSALKVALDLAEANGGTLRSCWGILPIELRQKTDFQPYPGAKDASTREQIVRVEISYDPLWKIDRSYWAHMQARFGASHPVAMAEIGARVAQHLAKERA